MYSKSTGTKTAAHERTIRTESTIYQKCNEITEYAMILFQDSKIKIAIKMFYLALYGDIAIFIPACYLSEKQRRCIRLKFHISFI